MQSHLSSSSQRFSSSSSSSLLPYIIIVLLFIFCKLNSIESFSLPTTTTNKNKLYNQQQQQHQQEKHTSRQLSLVTWNILAQEYAIPYKYPWVTTTSPNGNNNDNNNASLQWSKRKKQILQQIQTKLDYPDILCLQEVDIVHWDNKDENSFKQDLYKLGYTQTIVQCRLSDNKKKKKKGVAVHPIVNIVAIQNNCGLEIVRSESRSRALIAVLRYHHHHHHDDDENQNERIDAESTITSTTKSNTTTTTTIYLANVHLEAQSTKTNVRYNQLSSLFKRLYKQCQLDNDDDNNNNIIASLQNECIFMVGDFNFEPNDELYRWIVGTTTTTTDDDNDDDKNEKKNEEVVEEDFIPHFKTLPTSSSSSSSSKKEGKKKRKESKKKKLKKKRNKKKKIEPTTIHFTKQYNDARNTIPPFIDAYQDSSCHHHHHNHHPKIPKLKFTHGSGIILDYIFASSNPTFSSKVSSMLSSSSDCDETNNEDAKQEDRVLVPKINIIRTLPQLPYFHHHDDDHDYNNDGDLNNMNEDSSNNNSYRSTTTTTTMTETQTPPPQQQRRRQQGRGQEQPFLPIPSNTFPSDHIPIGIVFNIS